MEFLGFLLQEGMLSGGNVKLCKISPSGQIQRYHYYRFILPVCFVQFYIGFYILFNCVYIQSKCKVESAKK